MTTQAHGTTYLYVTPDGQRREIGVIRGLGDTWIVGSTSGLRHSRIKTPRLPAGSDPAALQALLDTWAAERGLPVATPGDAAPAPAAAERQQSEAVPPHHDHIPQVLLAAERGIIPADLEACAGLLRLCARIERVADNVRWMTIARAKDLLSDPAEWLAWVEANYADYRSRAHIHHIYAVGSFLLRECGHHTAECGHHTLFDLQFDALLSISRLPPNLVAPFLERARPAERSRDEVRAAVNRWLAAAGEPPADDAPASPPRPPRSPAVQQDFLDALFAASSESAVQFRDRVVERAGSVDDALPIINRAVVILDAMIPRLDSRRPEAFGALAAALRDEAAKVEALGARLGRQLPPATQE